MNVAVVPFSVAKARRRAKALGFEVVRLADDDEGANYALVSNPRMTIESTVFRTAEEVWRNFWSRLELQDLVELEEE